MMISTKSIRSVSRLISNLAYGPKSLSTAHRLALYTMLMHMVNDGIALDAALRRLHERLVSRKRSGAGVIKTWLDAMSEGGTFSSAIKGFVPDGELILIASGERANAIGIGFEEAIFVCEARKRNRTVMVSNLTMPVVLLVVFFAILVQFSIGVAPELAKVLPPDRWTKSGQTLYAISEVVSKWWGVGLLCITIFSVASWVSLSRWTGELRDFANKIPPWSMYRTFSSAEFMISISSLMNSGVSLPESLKIIRVNASPWMAEHISLMQSRLRAGLGYDESLDTGLLEDDVADEVVIYSKTSSFDVAIKSVGRRAIDASSAKVISQAAFLRTFAIALVGLSVGWIYMTVFGLNGEIGKSAKAPTSVIKTK